jgi:hypothetical protein
VLEEVVSDRLFDTLPDTSRPAEVEGDWLTTLSRAEES